MKRIVCNTKFRLDPFSDGGSKRSVQIRELLKRNSIAFIDDPFTLPKNASRLQLAKLALRAISFIHRHYPNRIKSLSRYIHLTKYYALRIPIVLDKYKDQNVDFLWENTNDRDMLYLLKATGHKVIGMPHNLESLVFSKSVEALEEEIDYLRHCDVVFAISKEETWLLRLLGLNAYYLPYYPPKDVESFLNSIRSKRELKAPNSRKSFLLLGSATNTPTRIGMQALIDYVSTQELTYNLLVAGYGTESLNKVTNKSISFLGALSNEELEKMLIETDGVIIFQPPTTGALTRIPEMLTAGVPVYVNFDGARNYLGNEGIKLYISFEDLVCQLDKCITISPSSFVRDNNAEKRFLDYLSDYAPSYHNNY